MSARESYAITLALRDVLAGATLSQAARNHGCHVVSVRRAMRRHGHPPRNHPSKEQTK